MPEMSHRRKNSIITHSVRRLFVVPFRVSLARSIRGAVGVPLLLLAVSAVAQSFPASNISSASAGQLDGRLVLVLPFDNQSSQPGLDWIAESFPTLLNERLRSAGFLTIRREDRQYALQHLGLPKGLHPTHATIYRIAQTLDVDDVILGSYTVADGKVTTSARIFEMHGAASHGEQMHGPKMSAALEEAGNLNQLLDVEDGLAWQIAQKVEPGFSVEKQTFLAAGHGVRLDTLENYIRGITEAGSDERIRHLNIAVKLSPNDTAAWLALGKAYFASQQYALATEAFSKIPATNHRALEAQFYSGLADLFTGQYAPAQASFATVAAALPLPEVLNNQGIAMNRQGQDGTALIARAVQLDPQNANEWFNLAVSERRTHHLSKALDAIQKALAIQPNDAESLHLKEHILAEQGVPAAADQKSASSKDDTGAQASQDDATENTDDGDSANSDAPGESADVNATADASGGNYEPLERITRKYNETSFRQAAFEMEQMRALKLRSLPSSRQAAELCKEGQGYINQGLLLEAEREFQQALAVAPGSAQAHAGMAQIRELTGDATAARKEAETSLQLRANVPAHLVLARLDVAQHQLTEARQELRSALLLDPSNSAAHSILQQLQAQEKATP